MFNEKDVDFLNNVLSLFKTERKVVLKSVTDQCDAIEISNSNFDIHFIDDNYIIFMSYIVYNYPHEPDFQDCDEVFSSKNKYEAFQKLIRCIFDEELKRIESKFLEEYNY